MSSDINNSKHENNPSQNLYEDLLDNIISVIAEFCEEKFIPTMINNIGEFAKSHFKEIDTYLSALEKTCENGGEIEKEYENQIIEIHKAFESFLNSREEAFNLIISEASKFDQEYSENNKIRQIETSIEAITSKVNEINNKIVSLPELTMDLGYSNEIQELKNFVISTIKNQMEELDTYFIDNKEEICKELYNQQNSYLQQTNQLKTILGIIKTRTQNESLENPLSKEKEENKEEKENLESNMCSQEEGEPEKLEDLKDLKDLEELKELKDLEGLDNLENLEEELERLEEKQKEEGKDQEEKLDERKEIKDTLISQVRNEVKKKKEHQVYSDSECKADLGIAKKYTRGEKKKKGRPRKNRVKKIISLSQDRYKEENKIPLIVEEEAEDGGKKALIKRTKRPYHKKKITKSNLRQQILSNSNSTKKLTKEGKELNEILEEGVKFSAIHQIMAYSKLY